jgi:hypothetical protein
MHRELSLIEVDVGKLSMWDTNIARKASGASLPLYGILVKAHVQPLEPTYKRTFSLASSVIGLVRDRRRDVHEACQKHLVAPILVFG